MASAGEKALHAALKKRVFDPVYYLFGEDDFLKEQATRDLDRRRRSDPSTRDFNLEMRRAGELDAEALDALLGTPPMLAERRVVVLRDVDKLKKGARTLLDRYLGAAGARHGAGAGRAERREARQGAERNARRRWSSRHSPATGCRAG